MHHNGLFLFSCRLISWHDFSSHIKASLSFVAHCHQSSMTSISLWFIMRMFSRLCWRISLLAFLFSHSLALNWHKALICPFTNGHEQHATWSYIRSKSSQVFTILKKANTFNFFYEKGDAHCMQWPVDSETADWVHGMCRCHWKF